MDVKEFKALPQESQERLLRKWRATYDELRQLAVRSRDKDKPDIEKRASTILDFINEVTS